jgi:hypothetical protein
MGLVEVQDHSWLEVDFIYYDLPWENVVVVQGAEMESEPIRKYNLPAQSELQKPFWTQLRNRFCQQPVEVSNFLRHLLSQLRLLELNEVSGACGLYFDRIFFKSWVDRLYIYIERKVPKNCELAVAKQRGSIHKSAFDHDVQRRLQVVQFFLFLHTDNFDLPQDF